MSYEFGVNRVYLCGIGVTKSPDFIKRYADESIYPYKGLFDTYRESHLEPLKILGQQVSMYVTNSEPDIMRVEIPGITPQYTPLHYNWKQDKESLDNIIQSVSTKIAKSSKEQFEFDTIAAKGANMEPEIVDISTPVVEEIQIDSSANIQEQYMNIVSQVSKLTKNINSNTILKDSKEVAEAFMKTKKEIESLSSSNSSRATKGGFMARFFKPDKEDKPAKGGLGETVQSNIDYLFGLVHEKYNRLLTTGEDLQKTKGQLIAQLQLLDEIAKSSAKVVDSYGEAANVPMRILALDTQIKASQEKYKDRLLKIDGAVLATQTTIIALGKDLPAMKTDLTDELAISGLLSDVGDYQAMYAEIASLVADVTTKTSEQTHDTIENVLTMQIEDTHTTDYLVASAERGENFAKMISEKSQLLAEKTIRDAEFIKKVASGNQIEHARSAIKQIEG